MRTAVKRSGSMGSLQRNKGRESRQEKKGEWTLQVIECQDAETRFHNTEPLKLPKGNTSYLCLRKVSLV